MEHPIGGRMLALRQFAYLAFFLRILGRTGKQPFRHDKVPPFVGDPRIFTTIFEERRISLPFNQHEPTAN